tara:strand:+ start:830 stop:1456 length:627 start_codon:yes stop_codon:yes gene_type:complete
MNQFINLITTKIPRPVEYHDFSDKNLFLGISNGKNIVSNLCIGAPALYLILKQKKISLLSIHILLLAITSAYYHIEPNHNTIFLDMIFLVGVNTIILSLFLTKEIGIFIYILGIVSVIYWKKYDDIRFYEMFKIGIPIYVTIILYQTKASNYIIPLLSLAILVRYSEFNDKEIYVATNQVISGHTLKHILGGIELYVAILVLQKLNKV